MARHLAVDSKIAGEAPDFLEAIVAIKDEISIFVLAVGPGTNVILESPLNTSTKYGKVGVERGKGVVKGLALSPGGDSIGERQRRDGSRRAHPTCES